MKKLTVAPSGRFLQTEDGAPFFYLGDTAWELFHRLSLDEAKRYLDDRAEKGFTVIQAVVLGELDGLTVPNANGDVPFADLDTLAWNEAYFRHVDAIVEEANTRGLYIGMLPSWGCFWHSGSAACVFDEDKARAYAETLAGRYRDAGLIWVLGGDRRPAKERDRRVVAAFAEGLRAGDGGAHLITFHPCGPGMSAEHFHEAPWLDFNMCQTSHAARNHDNGAFIRHCRELTPGKPVVDGEPRYEQIPVGFYNIGMNPAVRFDDYDARQAAYFAVFSGACGHTYGNNNIWQMYDAGREPRIHANVPWHEALHHPGAQQMGILRRLMERLDFARLAPANGFIVSDPRTASGPVLALKHESEDWFAVYTPDGSPVELEQSWMRDRPYAASWFSPAYGTEYPLHRPSDNAAFQTYVPPTQGRGADWVLLLKRTDS